MEIREPKVELWDYKDNPIEHIAKCARICYASTKITDNEKFVRNLWKNKHYSMFRHVGVYYKIPKKLDLPFSTFIDTKAILYHDTWYISTNMQCAKEYFELYKEYEVPYEQVLADEMFFRLKLIRYTFCIETGIDITRELNRKSPNNIAEQSTRYVDFNKKIGIVFKKCHWMYGIDWYKKLLVKLMCKTSEWFYKISRSKFGLNLQPQDARWILPLDIMSKAVYTYTVRDWEYIINMRLFDYTGKAHNDAKMVAHYIMLLLEEEGYDIVNYKEEENEH